MKLKLDENITVVAMLPLRRLGHDVDTVVDELLTGRPDPDVLAAAVAERRMLVTSTLASAILAPTHRVATTVSSSFVFAISNRKKRRWHLSAWLEITT